MFGSFGFTPSIKKMMIAAKCGSPKAGRIAKINGKAAVVCNGEVRAARATAKANSTIFQALKATQKASMRPWHRAGIKAALKAKRRAVQAQTKAHAAQVAAKQPPPTGPPVATRFPGQACPPGTRGIPGPRGGKIFCYRG